MELKGNFHLGTGKRLKLNNTATNSGSGISPPSFFYWLCYRFAGQT